MSYQVVFDNRKSGNQGRLFSGFITLMFCGFYKDQTSVYLKLHFFNTN